MKTTVPVTRRLKTFRAWLIAFMLMLMNITANASFYQSTTLAQYCREYIKYSDLDSTAASHEAGICAGYLAAAIDLMDLSQRLCDRQKLNLDNVASLFVDEVEKNPDHGNKSATFVLVQLLQKHYACDSD